MEHFLDKKSARKYFLEKRLAISSEALSKASDRLCDGILGLKEFDETDLVLLYYPSRNEPDLLRLMDKAIEMGKSVAFPISLTDTYTLCFKKVCSANELHPGAYGIPEPLASAETPLPTKKSLCVVPALAFDNKGFRLGYGKGYYDRFLSHFNGISVGAALDGHLWAELPTDTNDIPVDIIITERGVIRTK